MRPFLIRAARRVADAGTGGRRAPAKLPTALFIGLVALSAAPTPAISLYVSPEVPTKLGASTYLPSQAARYDSGVYSLALSMPPGTQIDALHRLIGGDWLVSLESATTIGATTYDPRDVFRTSGIAASLVFCGAAAGVPAGSNIDAVETIGGDTGDLAISFDVPTTLGAFNLEPADLLELKRIPPFGCSDWMPVGIVFDGSATAPPIPLASNLTAAGRRAPGQIFSLDVATSLGGPTVVPGLLESWNGALFAPFLSLAGWPTSTIVNALSFLADPGTVPPTMTAVRVVQDGSLIRLTWLPSCSTGAEDYGIYEGALGTWYSHQLVDCSDDFADLTEEIGTTSGNRYYLVVPRNPNDEGSYGTNSSAVERPQGSAVCIPTQVLGTCP